MVKEATSTRGAQPGTDLPKRRPFNVEEYHDMGRVGILRPDERVELIEGDIVRMSPIGGPHANCVNILTAFFAIGLAGRAITSIQNPVRLSQRREPQPDVALLRPRPEAIGQVPVAADALLLIEVADTTLQYDREVKVPLYAAAGIPEVWIVDISRRRVLVFRAPRDGIYQETAVINRDGSIAPLAFPDLTLSLSELFP